MLIAAVSRCQPGTCYISAAFCQDKYSAAAHVDIIDRPRAGYYMHTATSPFVSCDPPTILLSLALESHLLQILATSGYWMAIDWHV